MAGGTNSVIQRSFSGGLLTSHLAARADQVKYQTGLRECRNFIVLKHGGVANRPGTEFIAEVKDSDDTTRILDFVFNADQTYVLEFGDLYLRIHHLGAPLLVGTPDAWEADATITGATAANPVVITAVAHGFSNGDQVEISSVVGMTQLNGNTYTVANAAADTYELLGVDGTAYTAYVSGGTASRAYVAGDLVASAGVNYVCIADSTGDTPLSSPLFWYPLTDDILELPTPYAAADVFALQKVQNADVMTIVHPSYAPQELRRLGAINWTLSPVNFSPALAGPTGISVDGSGGTKVITYAVTAVQLGTFIESLSGTGAAPGSPGTAIAKTMASATAYASHIRFTCVAHGLLSGDEVSAAGFNSTASGVFHSLSEINGRNWIVTRISADVLELNGVKTYDPAARFSLVSTPYSVAGYAGAGKLTPITGRNTGLLDPSPSTPITIEWDASPGAYEYNVYRENNGVLGFIGTTRSTSFVDDGIGPDASIVPPINANLFLAADHYPSAIAYCQQRLALANTNEKPERVDLSRIGDFRNFATRPTLAADDAISFTIAGRQVNAVRHLMELGGKLLIFTGGSVWSINGDSSGTITPTDINLRQQGENGAGSLSPIVVESTALYLQSRGSVIRDIRYDIQSDGYRGSDLTIFSQDLFEGFTIVDWTYQGQPNSVVWAVRSDGALLGLTYIQDQQIWGWHRHDTDGDFFESVTSVPEGTEDVVYAVVRRTVDGNQVRYVERLHSRQVLDVSVDAFFVDCGATYDGRNTGATTLTLSGGTTWLTSEDLTLTASASQFVADDVGNEYRLNDGDLTLRLTVTGYTNATHVTVRATRDVIDDGDDGDYTVFRTGARTDWARAVDEITGLDHLEGRTVAICADGHEEPQDVVTTGALTLQNPAVVIHVGLPIVADLELLDLEDPQGETLVGRKKLVVRADVLVNQASGFFAGQDFDHLQEYETRDDEDWDEPTRLRTDTFTLQLSSTWDNHGRLSLRQTAPLPLEVLAVVRTGALGGR